MRVIGITGGVGAGKSQVVKLFEEYFNAYAIKADDVAKMLMSKGYKPYNDIVELIGEHILNEDESINRQKLSDIIFSSENKRLAVNSIVHPAVKKWIVEKITQIRLDGNYDYVVVEAALLLEDHYDIICDEIWYVYADEDVRRKRLKANRGYSDEKISSIYASQKSSDEFESLCDRTINNNGNMDETLEDIRKNLTEWNNGNEIS